MARSVLTRISPALAMLVSAAAASAQQAAPQPVERGAFRLYKYL